MPITINTNISAMSAQRNLGISSSQSASSLTKLSSGSRVPTAREDAASLSIGTGLRLDVAAFKAAQVNAMQASSLLQIADGAFSQITDILARMKSLATTAQSGQLGSTERGYLNTEFGQLQEEIDRIAATSEFNGVPLLGGNNTIELDAASTGITIGAGAGANIASDNGFVGFEFDDSLIAAADSFAVSYEDANNRLTLHRLDGALVPVESQTIIVATPTAGTTSTYNFDAIGVEITLNDQFANFDGTGDINTPALAANTDYQFAAVAGVSTPPANLDFQVGIGTTGNDRINVTIQLGDYTNLIGGGVPNDVTNAANAGLASGEIDTAVEAVNTARAGIGAKMNRLDFAQSNLAVTIENTEAARSTLMDVDVSAEITTFTSKQVLIQAGVSMLAQANQQPSLLLRLLQ